MSKISLFLLNHTRKLFMQTFLISRPENGQHLSIKAAADARFSLEFPADQATLERSGNDLTFRFEDGSSVNIADFYSEYARDTTPDFEVDGTVISGKDFFAAMGSDFMPAAGPDAAERGSHYVEHGKSELASGIDHLDGLDYGIQGETVVSTALDAAALQLGPESASQSHVPDTGPTPPVEPPAPTPHHERVVLSHADAGDTVSFFVRSPAGTPLEPGNMQAFFADMDQTWFENLTIDPVTGKISFVLTADGVNALKSGEAFFTNIEVNVDGKTHVVELYGKENNSHSYNSLSRYQSENYDSSEREQSASLEGGLTSETLLSSNREVKKAEIHLGGTQNNDVVIESSVELMPNTSWKYDHNAITGVESSTISSQAEKFNVSIDIKDRMPDSYHMASLKGITAGSSVKGGNETNILSNGGDLNLGITLESGHYATSIESANSDSSTVVNSGGGKLEANLTSSGQTGASGMSSVQSRTSLYSEGGDIDLTLKATGGEQGISNWNAMGMVAGTNGITEIKSSGGALKADIEVSGSDKLVSTEAHLGSSAYGMKALGADALNEINSGDGQLTVSIKVAAGHAANACAMFAAGGTNLIETTGPEDATVILTAFGDDGRGTAMRTDKSTMVDTQTGKSVTSYGNNIIRTGSGDDHIEINGAVATNAKNYSNVIDAGNGNNTIILNGSIQSGSLKIITGDGYDTLVLKADNFDQLKAFYGNWLNGLKRAGMIEDMSIDSIDIRYSGAEVDVANIVSWIKGYFGTDIDMAVNGQDVTASAATAFAALTPDDSDDNEHRQSDPADDDLLNQRTDEEDGALDGMPAVFSMSSHDGLNDSAPVGVFAEHSPSGEDIGDEPLFSGIWDNSNIAAASQQEWAQGYIHPAG
ncbi:MAG: hypothetical protein PHI96_06620, partial [Desulfovibrio sp.]|nr:hypothetical protein [Desulfovibrio sp.]